MARLIYSAITSRDGYVADKSGNFDWAALDEELHTFVNDQERHVGTYLYVRGMKAQAQSDLSVGGPDLAGQAIKAGLVDEIHLFLNRVVVGGGTQALPNDVRVNLELIDKHRFGSGVVHLHYRITN